MQTRTLKRLAVAALLPAAFAGYYLFAPPGSGASHAAVQESAVAAPALRLPDFTQIAERNAATVVNVSVARTVPVANSPFSVDPNDPFYDFFRRFGGVPRGGDAIQRGEGSGFIVGADGLILTNAHVVDGVSDIRVKLYDKREFKAKLVGEDRATDVAVLRVDASGLPTVKIGDPSKLKVGEWVVAIGSPFGLENTVTAGIVSAKSRALPDDNYVPFIQTDVAVNPGNSGGPLFNLNGEVVGINSQIYSRSGGFMGLSFAIPIDVAMKVQSQLVEHGHVTRGRLGVTIQDVNQELAKSFGMDKPQGALVSSVEPGGPADRAGVKSGDVILAVDGQPVAQVNELPVKIAEMKPGTVAHFEIWREGAKKTLEVTIGKAPDQNENVASNDVEGNGGRLGVAVRPLTPEERSQLDVKGGLVVEDVGGPAARAGIQPGDVILAVNGTRVNSVSELKALVGKTRGKTVALLVQREDARTYVPVEIG